MPDYTTPGIYVEETSNLPTTIYAVETAIPVFIGYTEKAHHQQPKDLLFQPRKISSLPEYEQYFGGACPAISIRITIDTTGVNATVKAQVVKPSRYLLYYSLQLFFANGGRQCYILAVGCYSKREKITLASLRKGVRVSAKLADVTLIVFPDATNMASPADYYTLHKEAMEQAAALRDRFVVMDIWVKPSDVTFNPVQAFRDFNFGGGEVIQYGAAYYPRLLSSCSFRYNTDGKSIVVRCSNNPWLNGTLEALKEKDALLFEKAKTAITALPMLLPSSPAVVGIYADTDHNRGVWKAPANAGINNALAPEVVLSKQQQEDLNLDPFTGRSINAIRSFPGRSSPVVWGARTLAGNSNEWRYISVRRYVIMVETSIKRSMQPFVFEPNDSRTWVRLRGMIENCLTGLWRVGAMQGATTQNAFYVHIGLGQTMTAQDILEGRLIVDVGMAVVRPAEFMHLRFVLNMMEPV